MSKLLLLGLMFFITSINSVDAQKTAYNTYYNQAYHFSFDIPNHWIIRWSKLQESFVCAPKTKKEKADYNYCYDGIIFKLECFHSSLDSVLLKDDLYSKKGNTYYTSDRFTDSIKTKNIKGKNWIGIYHDNVCGISCKDNGFHAAGGQCQFVYFSKGKTTICINTNGKEFDKSVFKKILSSFHFD